MDVVSGSCLRFSDLAIGVHRETESHLWLSTAVLGHPLTSHSPQVFCWTRHLGFGCTEKEYTTSKSR